LVRGYSGIGRKRIDTGQENKDAVYNAVRNLTSSDPRTKGVKLEDIWKNLDERTRWENKQIEQKINDIYENGSRSWTPSDMKEALRREEKKTITIRTIQNCIKKDRRIKKDGWYFYIDNEARFEKRYLNPSRFGLYLYRGFFNEVESRDFNRHARLKKTLTQSELLEVNTKDLIVRLGFFLIFSLIEAAKPFKDKSMDVKEREDLVRYWIEKAMPISEIFYVDFLGMFDKRKRSKDVNVRMKVDRTKPISEMDEASIQEALTMLEHAHPDLYKSMIEAYNEENPYTSVIGQQGYVRGKTYHMELPE
jgi:hypothetical protein